MAYSDSMKKTLESRFASIKENIDIYISSHYEPSCADEDLIMLSAIEKAPEDDTSIKKRRRSFIIEEDSANAHRGIDDLLKRQGETFSQMLLRLIDERNLKDSEVYKDANIDRRLFSKIRGDEDYIPSKKTVLCFCMALKLDLSASRKLLETAGYALSTSSRFDLIIMYLLENKEYNVVFANIVLEQYGENALTK